MGSSGTKSERFPMAVRDRVNIALTIAAEGSKADIAKPLKRNFIWADLVLSL